MNKEQLLIAKSLAGEEGAFDQLVQMHQRAVFHHCLSVVKDLSSAEDLTQETFVKAYQHLSLFRQQARFSTWLWRIAHNLCLNYIKKQHPTEEFVESRFIPTETTEKKDSELLLNLEKGMEHLPEKQRIVFEMYMKKKMRQKEIAQELGLPEGTIRSRIYYAKKNMRKYIKSPEATSNKTKSVRERG